MVRHKSWYLLFFQYKDALHSFPFSVIFSRCNHVTLVKIQASWQEGTPCLTASFRSVNHRRPLSPFWQISSSSSIGCGILLSVSFWHGREGRTRAPCCCNYITAGLAAPSPLTQLFLENINFIVSFEIMAIFEAQQELGWGLRMGLQLRDACVGGYIMSQEWLWQMEEFTAKQFTFMVCLKHLNDPLGLFSLSW